EEIAASELSAFLGAYAEGTLPDYQMSAFLMAVYFRGLTPGELAVLVEAMLRSGVLADLSGITAPKIDKHSTGGVGDKVSIVLAPLVASLGICVPMMSGRALGHTGGTVDKLESIPGFRTELSVPEFRRQLESVGCALITQTTEMVKLDKKLYALRDVTATVESVPLIASSIMSKKIAEGIDGLLLDVKRGNGAFLPDLGKGIELARTMIGIGEAHGRKVVALLTAMDRPLGHAVGNALEVEECVLTLRGGGPADLRELTVAQAVEMVMLARGGEPAALKREVEHALDNGRALEMMRRVITAQGGNAAVLDDPALLPQAPLRRMVEANRSGVIEAMDVRAIGEAAVALGAGRKALDTPIDPAAGFHITVKPGAQVTAGQPIATVFAARAEAAQEAVQSITRAIRIGDGPAAPLPLISHRITAQGIQEITA
ncbi:MAG TPA: thymidine phosphorylase, partial [Longimicrobiales bacterium]|nr:thymidine phosphorylase [Longimicrobiales bacterium]